MRHSCESFPCTNKDTTAECAAHPYYITPLVVFATVIGATTGKYHVNLTTGADEANDCARPEEGYDATVRQARALSRRAPPYPRGETRAAHR